jgi:CRP/FNR family transcriptional regulator, anaerobic regulatory protein
MPFTKIRNHITHFIDMEGAEMDDIIKAFSVIKYSAKTYIIKKGQVCQFIGFINEGCVEYFIKTNKKEQVISFPRENSWIGDLGSLLTMQTTNIYIKALEDTELLILDKARFTSLIKNHSSFLLYYLKAIHELYMTANEQHALLLSHSAEERYDYLLQNMPDLISRISDKYLASYLGVQPPSLSRIKRKKSKRNDE